MMILRRYTPDRQTEWDTFIEGSKNGTFLFMRGYMDYHSDRFQDHSLMYYSERGKLLAVLPANKSVEEGGALVLYSHQGLTYGGFIMHPEIHAGEVRDIFHATLEYLKKNVFSEWYYKAMPTIYHVTPAQEDDYWLWRLGAEIVSCGLSSSIDLGMPAIASTRKNSYRNKLKRNGYSIQWNAPLSDFWPILEQNLMAVHQLRPVHTLEEMELLKSRFSENIVCCVARNAGGAVESGTVLFLTPQLVHTQYISASVEGKHSHAMDFLMLELIDRFRSEGHYHFFDFGISTEDHGEFLNDGLCLQKEGFGGRGVVYKTYRLQVK